MTVAEPLQSKLVSMGMLSPQPNQESLPLGPEMQVASLQDARMLSGAQRILMFNSQTIRTWKKFTIIFPGRAMTLLTLMACE